MNKNNIKNLFITSLLSASLLVGCTTATKEQTGSVLGGVLGGVIGSQIGSRGSNEKIVAIVGGTLLGAWLGNIMGKSMDEQDKTQLNYALEETPTGQQQQWVNPDTNNTYAVTPTKTYQAQGNPCREFTMDGYINGQSEKIYGTACRQDDGSWKVVK